MTGFEIMFESIKQLTDTGDKALANGIAKDSLSVEGVVSVKTVKTRAIGSGNLVDMTILTDNKISATAAHAIGEKVRWKVIESFPSVMDVLVRTQVMISSFLAV
jgi:divalent metal cation (Fe/Co/Zn/Cd) transporter